MVTAMNPVMTVERSFVDGKMWYKLILSRENFNHLCAGCPDFDRLFGHSPGGGYFVIFPNPSGEMPKSFRLMPDKEGYFAYVGVPVPRLPQNVSNTELDRLSQQAWDNLEKAINESGKIPIEEEMSFGTVNLGYVVMRVER